jgi:hypothetical protein
LIGDPNELVESRLESLTENVPSVPQPNWSQMPVYQGTFGTGHMGGWTGYHPSLAAGGGRLYIANPDMWRVDMYDATTRAYLGKFGEVPGFESCLQTAVLCVPTGITYYHGKVYVVDDSDRVFVFNASGGFVRQLQMPLDISGIDAAWGELWITSEWGLGDLGQSFVNEHAQTVYVLDADTLVLKGVLEHPAAPWAVTASEPSLQKWDTRWTDVAIAPEVGAVYAGYRSIARGVLPLSIPVSDPLAQCSSGCDATALFEKGADAVWGMRWLMATTGYPDGDCSHCVTSQSWINEYSLDSAVNALPSLNRRRRWQPATANNRTSQLDVHYLNREVRIDWSGPLTKSDWINGSQNVDYIVSDADIFVVGDQAEHWYELARNFSRVELKVDGALKASSTNAQGTLSFDTNTISSGVHTLTLTAYLNDGTTVVSTNSQLRIDHDAPTGNVSDPGRYVSGPVTVEGTAADAHSGQRDWQLEALAPGGSWRAVCNDTTADPATQRYSCGWSTDDGSWPDGQYRLRARVRDNVDSRATNITYSSEVTTIVDNTPPAVTLSGTLSDAADFRPLHDTRTYPLTVTAQDAASGVKTVDILVDSVSKSSVSQACTAGGCPLSHNFGFAPADYADGSHRIEVVVHDQAGRSATRGWDVDVEWLRAGGPEGGEGSEAAAEGPEFPTASQMALMIDAAGETLPCTSEDEPANFPVYSVGTGFEGLSLTTVDRRCEPPDPEELPFLAPESYKRANWVSYIYGDCTVGIFENDEEVGCSAPLVVQTWPACERNLSSYSLGPLGALPHEPLEISGVPAASFEGGLRVEVYTGTSTVVVFAQDPAQALRAAAALRAEATGEAPSPPTGGELPEPARGALEGALRCAQTALEAGELGSVLSTGALQ